MAAGGPYDGTYPGKRVRVDGPAELCPPEDGVSVTINGTTLKFTNSRYQDFYLDLEINKEGSFDKKTIAEGTIVLIKGRIIEGTLDADVQNFASDNKCKYHWHLTKQP
jgi:hypothetical protein